VASERGLTTGRRKKIIYSFKDGPLKELRTILLTLVDKTTGKRGSHGEGGRPHTRKGRKCRPSSRLLRGDPPGP